MLFERGSSGRNGVSLPPIPARHAGTEDLPAKLVRAGVDGLPEISELEIVRHFTRLSVWNHGIDTGFYPLGSCTMKYNPKSSEAIARLPGFANVHPLAPPELCQGALELMWRLERALSEIAGFDATTLSPAAGAHGELCGLMVIRAYHEAQRKPAPQGAHPRHRPRDQPGVGGAQRLRRACSSRRGPTGGSTRRRCAPRWTRTSPRS